MYYILVNREPVPEASTLAWSSWMTNNRELCAVAFSDLASVRVSTIFVGLDMRVLPGKAPLLYETLVVLNGQVLGSIRYTSWDDAASGHASVVSKIRPLLSGADLTEDQILQALDLAVDQ